MKALIEREVKLAPPENLDLTSLGGTRARARSFDSTYYDTAGRDLLRWGVTLRRRLERRKGAWQLKVPSGKARVELEFADAESPPGEVTALLVALTRRAPIEPVARLKTRRETVRVSRDGVHVADVVRDAVTVLDGEEIVGAFDEVEIELADGAEHDLEQLERALRDAGATDAGGPSKLARALGVPPGAVNGAPPPEETPAGILRQALRTQYERLVLHDPGTRTGLDPEDLHQFRVATRRLRAFLRAGSDLLDREWADETRAELKWLGGTLGVVRDQDVLIEHLRGEAGELDEVDRVALEALFAALDAEREAARAEFPATLDSDRYLVLLDRLGTEPPLRDDAGRTLTSIWRREYRRTRKAFRALGDDSADDELHAARIRVKRARYAAELAGPELGKKGAAFVDAAKELQDVLGAHQDAVVGEQVLRRLAPELPGAALAMGRLVDRERARRAEARAAWRPAWRELKRRARALDA
jgi:CHAD domain-containing protein